MDYTLEQLEGRTARCSCRSTHGKPNAYGQTFHFTDEAPSSPDLPFFEYRGPGNKMAQVWPASEYPYDAFYCGCRGWD